jgi:competence protein ComEC
VSGDRPRGGRALDLRLAIPAGCAWIATAIGIGLPTPMPLAAGGWVAAAALIAAALVTHRAWLAATALAAVAVALCCTSIALQAPSRAPDGVAEAARSGRQVTVVATTTQTMLPGRGSSRVSASVVTIGGATVSGAIPMLVFGERPTAAVGIGATIRLTGTLTATDPGDETAFLLFPESPPMVVAPPPWYLDWANGLRSTFVAAASALPGDGGDLLGGLAIGDTSAVSDELDAAMKSTSLSHLTAVSGANCAVIIGLIMGLGALIGVPRAARIAASATVLVAFVVLVTPEPSVLRAALMAMLVLLALLLGRPVRGLPVLALATIALLVADPWLARSYGFVLSVLATGGLLLWAGPLARVIGRWLPRWLSLVIAVPLAAQLACQPVIILLNASVPTYGVVANILAEPAAPVATVLGLASCVALVVLPPLGTALCALAWLPSAWIAGVAQFFAWLPFAQLPWPGGVLGVTLLALVSGLVLFCILGGGPVRRWIALLLAVGAVAYAGLAIGDRVAGQLGRPADWQIAGCDIGQGDAVVVRSAGKVALIDTGPTPALLTACLATLGIDRIDLLVLTHYDLDHVGGTSAVLGRVTTAFVGPPSDANDERLRQNLAAGGATVEQVSRGPSGLLGELRWHILWPPKKLPGIEPGNPASVTVQFDPVGACVDGCLSSLFLGDLGERAQQLVLAANAIGPVDVVKVAHHGSADQSERMYQQAHAVVGVIGVGVDNGYGHPTERLLDILARAGTTALRTDEHGLILLAPGTTPGTVRVWTER